MRALIAIPDLITNSYFAALAAVELGCFARRGIAAEYALIFPSQRAYAALRDGSAQFVAAPAHSALVPFPRFCGVRLLAALSQGMYWKLVLRADLRPRPGDPAAARGLRIGAAPMVDLGLRYLLAKAGVDIARQNVRIVPVPGADAPGASFGVTAALALQGGDLDGFWANGMGAAVAVQSGVGIVVLDVRRGLGPAAAMHATMPVLAAAEELIASDRPLVEAAISAVVEAEAMLRADPQRADWIANRIFPPADAELIGDVVREDLPFTTPDLSRQAIAGLCEFACAMGLLHDPPEHGDIVPDFAAALWQGSNTA